MLALIVVAGIRAHAELARGRRADLGSFVVGFAVC